MKLHSREPSSPTPVASAPLADYAGRSRAFCFSLPPALALVLVLPVLLELVGSWRAYIADPVAVAFIAPIALAVAGAPGYVYAAALGKSSSVLRLRVRWWLRLSLVAAIVASSIGVWAGTWVVFFAPPSVVSLGCALYLLWRIEHGRSCRGQSAELSQRFDP